MGPSRRARRRDAGRPRGQPVTDAVLEATLAELATAGLEGLSVERVARQADVNKTTIYRRWPTREALVAAALEGIADAVAANAPDTGTLRGDLIDLLWSVAAFVAQPEGRAVARAAMSAQAEADVAALAARRLDRHTSDAMQVLVARAEARGEWREGVPGERVIHTLVGAILHRALLEHAPMPRSWLEDVVDVVLLGVVPRPPPTG